MAFGIPQWIVLAVAVLRAAELVYARHNTKLLLADGAEEFGSRHYPLFVILHGGWLLALLFGVEGTTEVNIPILGVFGLLLFGRLWVILTLGPYWTTRIISSTEFPLIRNGPYRLLRHPNYWIVTGEVFVLPVSFGAWQIAILFSILNAALLLWRIRVENEALALRTGKRAID